MRSFEQRAGVESLAEARAIVRLDASIAQLNADGIVHGVHPSLAGAAMRCVLRTRNGDEPRLFTIERDRRHARAASKGAIADRRVVRAHRSVAFTEFEIAGNGKRLPAGGDLTFRVRVAA